MDKNKAWNVIYNKRKLELIKDYHTEESIVRIIKEISNELDQMNDIVLISTAIKILNLSTYDQYLELKDKDFLLGV